MGARGNLCGGLLSFLLPPSRRLALTAGGAHRVGRQLAIAADQPAVSQDGDVLAFHEEVEQSPAVIQGGTTAPVGAVPLAAGQLVPLDADHLGADSELLTGGVHEGERAGAVDWSRREGQLGGGSLDLLDRGRRLGRSRLGLVEGDPAEDEEEEQDQRNAHVQRPGLHGPEKPIAVVVGIREGIGNGHRAPRGGECYGTIPSHCTHRLNENLVFVNR